MKMTRILCCGLVIGLFGGNFAAKAAVVPVTEDFTANVANWADSTAMNLLNHVTSGGPDGGAYASMSRSLMGLGGTSSVLFRAQDELNSSSHAFEGNWLTDGVGRFSALVRHNAPQPLSYFTRFSSPANFPGGTAVKFAPVPPNTWAQLTFDIRADNPEFVTFEGSNFNTVFSNIGHVQLGVSVPAALNDNTTAFTFDIDKASLAAIPEPATLLGSVIASISIAGGLRRRRIPE
jgi:hypothetical protein